VLVDFLERVDAGAEALRHAAAVAGLDHRVDVDVAEGHVAGELDPGHDHARDPEEEDLPRGRQEAGRVKGAQLRRVVGPAERREGPDRRAEPGVEHILLLAQGAATIGAALRLLLGDDQIVLTGIAVPDRNPVPPPELAGDAPGSDLAHPVEVDPLPLRRRDPHLVALDHLNRRPRKLVHAAEPLQRDQRLDPLTGAVRERDRVQIGLLGADATLLAQRRDHRLLGLGDGEPGEALSRLLARAPVRADHDDLLEAVLAADLKVVEVVARGDLERAGAELGVDVIVGDDLQPPPDQRQHAVPADQVRVALVVGVHRDRRVGEHRLRPHRRHGEDAVGVLDGIVDRVERVLDLAVLDLEVRDRRVRAGIPVDHVVVAVDVALVVELFEDPVNGAHVALVEGEALTLVVAGGAEALVLLDDLRPVLLFPGPDALDELLPPELLARGALRPQGLLDHRLGGDAGVIGAQNPEGVSAAHAVHADEGVLHGAVERVPHVEDAGHVGRRDRHREVLVRGPLGGRMEIPALHPLREEPPLDLRRLVARLPLQLFQAVIGHEAPSLVTTKGLSR
jgi:hypothetical protein